MEPVRGVKRRDRQGGRRSWWSKGEHLPATQQKELQELVAAAERAEENDAAPLRPQRRGTRRISWWSKNEDTSSQLKELQAAADEEPSEQAEQPNNIAVEETENDAAPMRPQRRGTRRISWWGKGEDATSQLKELQAAADEEPSEHDNFVPFRLQRRATRRISIRKKGGTDAKASEAMERVDAELSDMEKETEPQLKEGSSEHGVTKERAEQPLASQQDKRRLPQRATSVCLSADEGKSQRKKWWKKRLSVKREQTSPTKTESEE